MGYTTPVTLVVEFAQFVEAVRRFGEPEGGCVLRKVVGDVVHLTHVNASAGVQIVSLFQGGEEDVERTLSAEGLRTMRGVWVTEASLEHLARVAGEAHIAAVAYQTPDGPGVWMDAFPTPPSEGEVLRAIFDEFVTEGLLVARDFDTFLDEAKPQVRVLGPEEIERFLKQKPRP